MSAAIVVLAVIVIAAIGGTIWFLAIRRRLPPDTGAASKDTKSPLRLSYVLAPLAILLLTVALCAYFYRLLPAEVAYHFELDGTPDRWVSRQLTAVVAVLSQLLLTIMALVVSWGVTMLSRRFEQGGSKVPTGSIISFMGNIFALPQLVIGFAIADIFSYNSYQTHIMPMWIFLLSVLGLFTIGLGIFWARMLSKLRR